MITCPHCGYNNRPGPATCEKCGKKLTDIPALPQLPAPGPAGETRACPFCAEQIQAAAVVCRFCGRQVAVGHVPPPAGTHVQPTSTPQAWNPGVAAVLSLVIPGAGQMYKGNVGAGIAWLFCTIFAYFMLVIPGLVVHLICIINAASSGSSAPAAINQIQCIDCKHLAPRGPATCPKCGHVYGTPRSRPDAPSQMQPDAPGKGPNSLRMAIIVLAAVFAVAIGAAFTFNFGQSEPAKPVVSGFTTARDSKIDTLNRLTDAERQSFLRTIIVGTDFTCPRVTRVFHQATDSTGDEYWDATCSNAESYMVQVKHDATGSTRVMNCATVKLVGMTPCFTAF
jgi:TM2 domain-containing membrane protein YozV